MQRLLTKKRKNFLDLPCPWTTRRRRNEQHPSRTTKRMRRRKNCSALPSLLKMKRRKRRRRNLVHLLVVELNRSRPGCKAYPGLGTCNRKRPCRAWCDTCPERLGR